MDPDNLASAHASAMDVGNLETGGTGAKPWRDIWGCGQGIGAVHEIVPAARLVERLARVPG